MKYYLSITGGSTVGKTTLANALSQFQGVVIVPQVTCRPLRKDDDPKFIKNFEEESFKKIDFFIRHGNYGISSQDFSHFINSEKVVGVSVNGVNEITQLQTAPGSEFTAINILLRFTDSEQKDEEKVVEGIKRFFPDKKQQEERIRQNLQLIQEFFFDSSYIDRHISLILTREEALEEWILKIDACVKGALGTNSGELRNFETRTDTPDITK